MSLLSVVVVSAFESVGAILVVAMLILPGATAHLLSPRLPVIMGLTVLHAALSTILGFHTAKWLDCSIAGALVVAGMGLFVLAWIFGIHDGLLGKWLRRRQVQEPDSNELAEPVAWRLFNPAYVRQSPPAFGPLAQRLEQGTHNPLVAGSNPAEPTNFDDLTIKQIKFIVEENKSLKVKNQELQSKVDKYHMKKFEFISLFDD